ncbi:sphingosine-1-phosphate phosphohydrolase-like protein, partial [Aureobasidium melanogenum]|uniref:Sphingosine-1-phosphate phosphohydrolase-like protein n=1 Tax=Aureobasidium melanogenum (strain CBS 110374) TaxID=1043003 RepID=A0A074VTB0_AURM1
MSNVAVSTPPDHPLQQARALSKNLPDAGLLGLDHYSRKLPKWRYRLRQSLLPIVRWETPYLAKVQQTCRTPFLDSYFAMTANLGTHTFFMAALPVCFWCGYTGVGRALVHMLALGVFLSGWIKDLVCLPRPLSPPLQRITMSGSAALEYGFPSTHSTNAVSVAFYFLYQLHTSAYEVAEPQRTLGLCLGYFYAISIVLGRMYCGMHGFFDVIVGSTLGALIAVLQLAYGTSFDDWIAAGSWTHPAIVFAIVLLAVRFHPEPADNCPCYDDSVAFAAVVLGCQLGHWHFAGTSVAMVGEAPATVFFSLEKLGWFKTLARVVGGVVIVFLWRAMMKPLLLRYLPPLFRFLETSGATLPRRFFTRASEYKRVPPLRQDDNVIPSASDIPGMLSNLRHPRKRGISVGPQSEADAREFIANRERKRRESRSSADGNDSRPQLIKPSGGSLELESTKQKRREDELDSFGVATPLATPGQKGDLLRPNPFTALPLTPPASDSGNGSDMGREDKEDREDAEQDHQMFLALAKPRVRYDVEVVTKLVIYAGIAWLAVEGNPLLFEFTGVGKRSVL